MKKNEVSLYFENIIIILLGILFLLFPLIFSVVTTSPFIVPKQVLLASVVLISLFLFGAKTLSEGKVMFKRTPFDLPLFIFGLIILLSSVFSANNMDSLISSFSLIFAILAYFIIVNVLKTHSSLIFLTAAAVVGGVVSSALTILSYFKIYILPLSETQIQTFTPLGSLFDQAIYTGVLLLITTHFAYKLLNKELRKNLQGVEIPFAIASLILAAGLGVTIFELINLQKPILLPIETGFQTAFAAISQDAERIFQGFLFGSGFGNYGSVFTKFKQAAFNLNPALWSFTFFKSSSFILELLATSGILGILSYIFFISKLKLKDGLLQTASRNPVYLSLLALIVLSFIFPFSFILSTFLFLLLGLFAISQLPSKDYFDVELHFVAFKKGIIPLSTTPVENSEYASKEDRAITRLLPAINFIIIIVIIGVLGFFSIRYFISDFIFQKSLVAASQNKGLETYNSQISAISMFPYKDVYYRVYSQTNLALANSLATQQAQNSSPSAEVQQTIFTLIQQSIKAGRDATTIAPQSVANWQNLSSVYRSLIGFGENAENFAVVTSQQAILLDPNNPQNYISLGGIYYQLGQWENAQRQFQIAANLKPDFANAYYNLGHTLENKGDLKNALISYQTVKTLVSLDPENLKKINEEIENVQQKIGQTTEKPTNEASKPEAENKPQVKKQAPLEISTPSEKLPEQKNPVPLEPPTTATKAAE